MTMVGHGLLGLSLGALAIPRGWPRRRKGLAFGAFALLAGGPDWPLPLWGHSRYLVSHSLFVNLGLAAGVAALAAAWPRLRAAAGGWPVVGAGMAAWLSHLLLDSFYSHGKGVRIFWPLSGEALSLPMPWFAVLQRGTTPPAALRIFAVEFAFYGSLLGLCLLWRARSGRGGAGPGDPRRPALLPCPESAEESPCTRSSPSPPGARGRASTSPRRCGRSSGARA